VGRVNEGDNERYDGIATVVLCVGKDDKLSSSECEFWDQPPSTLSHLEFPI
jgi:hypothetical protein